MGCSEQHRGYLVFFPHRGRNGSGNVLVRRHLRFWPPGTAPPQVDDATFREQRRAIAQQPPPAPVGAAVPPLPAPVGAQPRPAHKSKAERKAEKKAAKALRKAKAHAKLDGTHGSLGRVSQALGRSAQQRVRFSLGRPSLGAIQRFTHGVWASGPAPPSLASWHSIRLWTHHSASHTASRSLAISLLPRPGASCGRPGMMRKSVPTCRHQSLTRRPATELARRACHHGRSTPLHGHLPLTLRRPPLQSARS